MSTFSVRSGNLASRSMYSSCGPEEGLGGLVPRICEVASGPGTIVTSMNQAHDALQADSAPTKVEFGGSKAY